jgi:hypothetical protein
MSNDKLIYASATALAHALRDRAVSSEELVAAYLARIEAANPSLNAVVQLAGDAALAQARQADAALARGEARGPHLDGRNDRARVFRPRRGRDRGGAAARRRGDRPGYDQCARDELRLRERQPGLWADEQPLRSLAHAGRQQWR